MKNRKLILILSLVLALTMSLGGTLAYLTDTDADVNVMTLGKVTIVQNEQRRVEADGEFTSVLEPFENDKTLLPYTDRKGTADKVTVGDYEIELGDSYNNYIDKIVSVTNTGNTDAWVRTLVALPTGGTEHWQEYDAAADVWLHWNLCKEVYTHWDLEELTGNGFFVKVNEVEYEVWQFTHKAPLAADKTTYPVIRGLFMDKRVDMNEEGYYLTDNSGTEWPIKNITDKNGKVNVLVVSQAVQADGFATADVALTEAFPYGENNVNVQKWFTDLFDENGDVIVDMIGSPSEDGKNDKNDTNNPPYAPVTSVEELLNADGPITAEVPLKLEKDESVTKPIQVGNEGKLELDLADNSLNNDDGRVFENNGGEAVLSNGTMDGGSATEYAHTTVGADAETVYNEVNITSAGGGVGAANGAQVTFNSGSVEVDSKSTSGRYLFYAEGEGSVITINGGSFDFNKTQNQKRAYIYAGAGTTVYVNGGTFGKASTRSGYTAGILGEGTVIITGGTFGFNPTTWVADGYVATQNDSTWTVAAE